MFSNLKSLKMNNIFRFKKFSVKQDSLVFKVGTDGVLLGCLANVLHAETILDIGTGTGLLALISAQKNPSARIVAIDSEEAACKLAQENIASSPFASSISVIHSGLQTFSHPTKFDYIICNPPYFELSQQMHLKHLVARHQLKLDYTSLLDKSSQLISDHGMTGYIFPYEDEEHILSAAQTFNLFPKTIVRISGIKNGKIRRTFLELTRQEQEVTFRSLYVEESPRIWSEEYSLLTQDFYL